MIKKIQKWFSYRLKELPREEVECKNCNTRFKGYYCPRCGQSTSEIDRPFNFVFYDFMGTLFAFDSRLLRSLGAILVAPGKLTREFIEGRRARYMSPFKFYIFISFIFFLLLNITTKNVFEGVDLNQQLNTSVADSAKVQLQMMLEEGKTSEVLKEKLAEAEVNDSVVSEIFSRAGDFAGKAALDTSLVSGNSAQEILEKQLEKNRDKWDDKQKAIANQGIKILRYPELYVSSFLRDLSWSLFLLMPLFAALLKLLYVRHPVNYMRHLIFSINLHAFNFALLSVVLAAYLIFSKETASGFLYLLIGLPVYLFMGMRRFYGQSYGKTFVKQIILLGVYNFILLLAISLVAYWTLIKV